MLSYSRIRWSTLVLAILVVALILTACGGAATPAPAPAAPTEAPAAAATPAQASAAPSTDQFKMAVVLTGPPDDNSWNEAGYNAIKAMEATGVETAYSESVADADVARVLRQYSDQGFQMIVAHSFSFQDGTFQVASEYPNVNYAWAGGINRTAENVADYDQPFYEAAYLVGIIAGHVSKTGKLGALYGFDIPVCHAMGEAMLLGAQTVNPDATLIQTAVGDWVDVAKAKEAALAQADAGVDFWIECGEGPALGAIEAAKQTGGYATGYVGDMSENGPDSVIVNLVWDLEPLFTQMMKDTQEGTFNAPYYRFGVKEGALKLVYNPNLKDQIPQAALDEIEATSKKIADGSFTVPFIGEAE